MKLKDVITSYESEKLFYSYLWGGLIGVYKIGTLGVIKYCQRDGQSSSRAPRLRWRASWERHAIRIKTTCTTQATTSVGKDVEKPEPSHTTGGDVNW